LAAPVVTKTESVATPPGPEQVRIKVVTEVIGLLILEPLVPVDPPGKMEQVVAENEVQVTVGEVPASTVTGPSEPFTLRSVSGALLPTVTVAEAVLTPPGPLQVSVYDPVILSMPVL